jgi:hypothetical protein
MHDGLEKGIWAMSLGSKGPVWIRMDRRGRKEKWMGNGEMIRLGEGGVTCESHASVCGCLDFNFKVFYFYKRVKSSNLASKKKETVGVALT